MTDGLAIYKLEFLRKIRQISSSSVSYFAALIAYLLIALAVFLLIYNISFSLEGQSTVLTFFLDLSLMTIFIAGTILTLQGVREREKNTSWPIEDSAWGNLVVVKSLFFPLAIEGVFIVPILLAIQHQNTAGSGVLALTTISSLLLFLAIGLWGPLLGIAILKIRQNSLRLVVLLTGLMIGLIILANSQNAVAVIQTSLTGTVMMPLLMLIILAVSLFAVPALLMVWLFSNFRLPRLTANHYKPYFINNQTLEAGFSVIESSFINELVRLARDSRNYLRLVVIVMFTAIISALIAQNESIQTMVMAVISFSLLTTLVGQMLSITSGQYIRHFINSNLSLPFRAFSVVWPTFLASTIVNLFISGLIGWFLLLSIGQADIVNLAILLLIALFGSSVHFFVSEIKINNPRLLERRKHLISLASILTIALAFAVAMTLGSESLLIVLLVIAIWSLAFFALLIWLMPE